MKSEKKKAVAGYWLLMLIVGVALLVSSVVVLGIGAVQIPVGDVSDVILRRFALIDGANVTLLNDQIVWQLRLPRVITAIAVGAVLAICGALLQTITGNVLADPYLLGISSGASVGAVAVIVLGISVSISQTALLMTAAFIGSVGALALVLLLATGKRGELPASRTILAGVAVAQVCSALTSLLILVVGESNAAKSAMSWMLGSLAGARWLSAGILCFVAVVLVLIVSYFARTLDAFSFGEVSAATLGVNVTRFRWGILLLTAFATAATVSFVGPIGFVGLTVPHIVRLFVGAHHAVLLPASALVGALLLLWSDTLARSLGGGSEIPIGIITALVGTPVLVYLLRKQART